LQADKPLPEEFINDCLTGDGKMSVSFAPFDEAYAILTKKLTPSSSQAGLLEMMKKDKAF